ncbi:hypothetical protein SK128_020671 [Halocaridina rubra]|uniref:F-box domain-containing protein n=1 Tax=Halocaridina rubra TaxID=373956 RepID=A0AAN8X3E2_HALRR
MGNTVVKSALHNLSMPPKDIPEDNGCVFGGKTLPPEVLENILKYVPTKDLCKSASRVCKHWNFLLSHRRFWFEKLVVEGISLPESLRTRLLNETDNVETLQILKILTSGYLPLNKNLIKNPSGEENLKYWEVIHGGDGVIVEETPAGSDPIPEEAGLPTQHCFVTSYRKGRRLQVIDLISLGFTPSIMDILKPRIEISEWVSARWDCRSKSELIVVLVGRKTEKRVSLNWSSDDDDVLQRLWYQLKEVVIDYPKGLHTIEYVSIGNDSQFWAGHYGAKSAGSSVKLILA